MDVRELERLVIEIMTGRPSGLPDTSDVQAMRAKLKAEIAAIKAQGGEVEMPVELPDLESSEQP